PHSTLFPYTTLFRSDHLVEGGVLGPAVIAIGDPELDIGVALPVDAFLRLSRKLFNDFDAVHFPGQFGEDRSLIAQAGADLEHRRSEEHTSELQSPDH